MVNLYIAITDWNWFDYLSHRPGLNEANFWQPGGRTGFQALEPGELFLFKLHSPRNFIAGGGVFSHSTFLPVSLAWEVFQDANGARSLAEMKLRVAQYRQANMDPKIDYQIGCRILAAPFFWEESAWIPIPKSWAPSIQVGKRYDTDNDEGRQLYLAVQERIQGKLFDAGVAEPSARYGEPTLIHPRLGQGTFRVKVTDAYDRRCAMTRERTLPVLQAAHIRPYADGGLHDVRNGLLLRSDIHTLFDRGYITVTPKLKIEVSKRIREEFENGRDYYRLHGSDLHPPQMQHHQPDSMLLDWHNSNKFLG